MNVSQVIEIAKEWVEENASQAPGFCGAHLAGAITKMPKDAPFPIYRDVDVNIVVKGPKRIPIFQQKLLYKGVLLECIFYGLEGYNSPEVVLSNPMFAHRLAVESVISDPTGMLTKLQRSVAQDYSQRRWVQARCESSKRSIMEDLDKMNQADSPTDAWVSLAWLVSHLGTLIAVAHLKPPTVRRCFALTKELLQSQGKLALHETVLKLCGYAHIDRGQVESYLQECVTAFERAVEVKRTPFYGDFNIHSYVRPYLVEGSQEMIDEGNHREAMFWITFFHYLANVTIQNDAPEAEKPQYQAGFEQLLSGLGLHPLNDWQSRIQLAKNVAEEFFQLADEVIENHPDIKK
jgi:hypothetical protein